MLTGFAVVIAFAGGMYVMFRASKYYEERIINMARGIYPEQKPNRRKPQQRPQHKEQPMIDEDDYDRLMNEGHIVKRR